MKKNIILIGGGGHCKACIDVIEQQGEYAIAGIVDLPEQKGQKVLGHSVIADDGDIPQLVEKENRFLITIGQIKTAERRAQLYSELKKMGALLPVVVSPQAYVSPHAKIGEGTIIMHGSMINAAATIGSNCIINSHAIIEHDAVIEDHCHISTGAIVNGEAHIKKCTFIGSQAMIRECIEIGEYSLIGGGASIFKNVPAKSCIKR